MFSRFLQHRNKEKSLPSTEAASGEGQSDSQLADERVESGGPAEGGARQEAGATAEQPDGQRGEEPVAPPATVRERPDKVSSAQEEPLEAGSPVTEADDEGETSGPEPSRSTEGVDGETTPPEPSRSTEGDDEGETRPPEPSRSAAVVPLPTRRKRRRTRALAAPETKTKAGTFTPQQRLLLLDTWLRSGLAAGDFAELVGVSKHTLYAWKKRFDEEGPGGLMDQPRGARSGSRLPDVTRRAILMLKAAHPQWGCQRISDMLQRGPALPAGPAAVARVLREAGYETVDVPTRPHPAKVRSFERARPNQLWQTDLFTFTLKRQNRRLYLVAFLDDHSRFLVSYGLHASASTALVLEALEAGIANYGSPEEVLTDNGPQYVTWRGKSQFSKRLEKRGIRQIVARPRRPQTLGKIERFWGTLWRECLEAAVLVDLADARRRIGLFIDYYNFRRTHRGIGGLVPADRFFQAAPDVLAALKQQVDANALELARDGEPKQPFYLTGQLEGKPFSIHREGERLILQQDGRRREIAWDDPLVREAIPAEDSPSSDPESPSSPVPLAAHGAPRDEPGEPATEPPPPPGVSALDSIERSLDDEQLDEEGGRS